MQTFADYELKIEVLRPPINRKNAIIHRTTAEGTARTKEMAFAVLLKYLEDIGEFLELTQGLSVCIQQSLAVGDPAYATRDTLNTCIPFITANKNELHIKIFFKTTPRYFVDKVGPFNL